MSVAEDRLKDLLNPEHYESQVLHFETGRTEREVDEQYMQDAITLGLRKPEPLVLPPPPPPSAIAYSASSSTTTVSSPSCRSNSSAFQTSHASRTSTTPASLVLGYPYKPSLSAPLRPRTTFCPPLHSPQSYTSSNLSSNLSRASSSIFSSPTSLAAGPAPPTDFLRSKSTTAVPNQAWSPRVLAHRLKFRRFSKQRKPASVTGHTGMTACRMCEATAPPAFREHQLLCGHTLCHNHLRHVVEDSSGPMREDVMQCCARSIPWAAAQSVLEQTTSGLDERILEELEQGDRFATESPLSSYSSSCGMSFSDQSGPPTPRTSSVNRRQSLNSDLSYRQSMISTTSHPQSIISSRSIPQSLNSNMSPPPSICSHTPVSHSIGSNLSHPQSIDNYMSPKLSELELKNNLERALQFPDFRSLRRKQEDQRRRFLTFRKDKRAALQMRQEESRAKILKAHATASTNLIESQPQKLIDLENRHLEAEMQLKEEQKIESRTCLVALRHMEGYCQGHDPEGTGRIVTLADRMKLERQYHTWRNLDQRQETATNILREQQARQLKNRAQKQTTEVSALHRIQGEELKQWEKSFDSETRQLENLFAERKMRLIKRWELAFDTWRGWREKDEAIDVPAQVEPLTWPSP